MNARRTLLILGAVILVLLCATVALAIFFHKKLETEKNQAKTANARNARWTKKDQSDQPEPEQEIKEPDLKLEEEKYVVGITS